MDDAESSNETWDWRVHRAAPLYREASMAWGHDAQMAKASEEFAELAAICARDLNGQADKTAFLAELVDARIMLEQLTQQITDEALDEMVQQKLERLDERLNGGEINAE